MPMHDSEQLQRQQQQQQHRHLAQPYAVTIANNFDQPACMEPRQGASSPNRRTIIRRRCSSAQTSDQGSDASTGDILSGMPPCNAVTTGAEHVLRDPGPTVQDITEEGYMGDIDTQLPYAFEEPSESEVESDLGLTDSAADAERQESTLVRSFRTLSYDEQSKSDLSELMSISMSSRGNGGRCWKKRKQDVLEVASDVEHPSTALATGSRFRITPKRRRRNVAGEATSPLAQSVDDMDIDPRADSTSD